MAAPDTLSSCSSAAAFSPFASYMYPVRPRYMSKENATHFGWQITQMKCTKCAPFISCRRAAPAMPPCHVASANSPPLAALPQQSAEVTCATICLGTRWQKYEAQNMSQLTQATGRPQKTLSCTSCQHQRQPPLLLRAPYSACVGTLSTPRPCIMGTLNCALI